MSSGSSRWYSPAKIVVLGADSVGKTTLILTCLHSTYPTKIPIVCDNETIRREYENGKYQLELWDTAGSEEYSRLRPLSFPETDLFVVVFSVADPVSLEQVEKYVEEIREHEQKAAFFVVGTKTELRDGDGDDETEGEGEGETRPTVSFSIGFHVADRLGAAKYVEVSAKRMESVNRFLDSICEFLKWLWRKHRPVSPPRQRGLLSRLFSRQPAAATTFREMNMDPLRPANARTFRMEKKRVHKERRIKLRASQVSHARFWRALSWDVVRYILSEFIVVDVHRQVLAFNLVKSLFLNDVEKSVVNFFGRFHSPRKNAPKNEIFQLFSSFWIRSTDSYVFLPKKLKCLIVGEGKERLDFGFRGDRAALESIAMQQFVGHGHSSGFGPFYSMSQVWGSRFRCPWNEVRRMEIRDCGWIDNSTMGPLLSRLFRGLRFLSLDGTSSCLGGALVGDLAFPDLQELVLRNCFCDISVPKLPTLSSLTIAGTFTNLVQLPKSQFETLLVLPTLRFLNLIRVDLKSAFEDSNFSGLSLATLILEDCDFNFQVLEDCAFEDSPNLSECVVSRSKKARELFPESIFPTNFVLVVQGLPNLEYLLWIEGEVGETHTNDEDGRLRKLLETV